MVLDQSPELDRLFHALADPTRRAMLRRLADGEHNLGELAAPFAMSFPAASKHVRVLEAAGLVSRRKQGRVHRVRIEADRLRAAQAWIDFYARYWTSRLEDLEVAIREKREERG